MQIYNINKYVTFINMFIFSVNRLTHCRGEGVLLFTINLVKLIYIMQFLKQSKAAFRPK